VALAGPLTNFLLAFVAFLVMRFSEISDFGYQFMTINLGFMIFNLLPIPPLDGSRILYAISPDVVRKFLNSVEVYGVFVVYFLILFLGNVFSGIMLDGMNAVLKFFVFITGA
jgi:Zn-dependent protease